MPLARRPRISILTALLVTTIAALSVAMWQVNQEVAPLRAEVRRLRQELGHLTIDDPGKIYAIGVHSPQRDVHRFRVYLPENRKFQIHLGLHEVAGRKAGQSRREWFKDVLDKRSGSDGDIRSGEFTIDVEVRQESQASQEGQWDLVYRINNAGGGRVGSTIPWLEDQRRWSISSEPPLGRQIEHAAEEGLVLFALRQATLNGFDSGYSTSPPDDARDAPGLIVWITAEPK